MNSCVLRMLQVLKDRFEAFVPALTRWGGTTVGLSLIGIGGLGLLELWQDHRAEQAAASADVALAGGLLPVHASRFSVSAGWCACHDSICNQCPAYLQAVAAAAPSVLAAQVRRLTRMPRRAGASAWASSPMASCSACRCCTPCSLVVFSVVGKLLVSLSHTCTDNRRCPSCNHTGICPASSRLLPHGG
jgi:hypothetical protein